MSDKLMRRILIAGAGVLLLCGVSMVALAVMHRDARMGLYGVLSLLFALSDVLYAIPHRRDRNLPWPTVSVEFDPATYRDPVSGARFLAATISTTVHLSDASARDVLTSSYREAFPIDELPERTSATANARHAQVRDACAGRT
ncbi:hypothetical protein [Bifidobacterium simiiventris]|uniref:hypothetical protein n=1 Tax=Bifidobacterium simiiventris TaxID=2834434 RepID=UPI001C559D33|nr:hypothetical protein [Bifidobacterium simiiventris]MBW3077724.1 hypothetical protein [Bifidobacterium simiiventris]